MNEDLMDILKGQSEVGDKYKTHFFGMFAQFFCIIAREVINEFGEDGKKVIESAVKKYGEERGRRIAELVQSLGKELSLKNFFIYGDLDSRSITKYKPKLVDGNFELNIRDCVFCNSCKDWNLEDYGKIYCQYVDKAILRGYNPDLKLEIPSRMMFGDKNCHFRYIIKKQ